MGSEAWSYHTWPTGATMSRIELSMVVKGQTASPTSMWTLPHSLSSTASLRAATRTRDQDVLAPTSSGADLSCGGSSSRVAPLAIEGVGNMDKEACLVATSTKDALGLPLLFTLPRT